MSDPDPEPAARFVATCGSVQGREHARLGRNNQDGVAIRSDGERLCAVVTDGCSAGRYSEVGARLGAAFLAEEGLRRLRRDGASPALVPALTRALLGYLRGVARGLHQGALAATVKDYFLFGFLGVILDARELLVFGLGDGLFSIDGQPTVLDPGPENAPAYLAYALLDETALAPGHTPLGPTIHAARPVEGLRSLVLATDGAVELVAGATLPLRDGAPQGGLEQFEGAGPLQRNPSLLHKRLSVIGALNRRLHDDTTLVVIRREEDVSWTS